MEKFFFKHLFVFIMFFNGLFWGAVLVVVYLVLRHYGIV